MSNDNEWHTVTHTKSQRIDYDSPDTTNDSVHTDNNYHTHNTTTPYRPPLQNSLRKSKSSHKSTHKPTVNINSLEQLHDVLHSVYMSIPGQVTLSLLQQRFDEFTGKSYKKHYRADYGSLLDVCYNTDKFLVIPHTVEHEYIIRLKQPGQEYTTEQRQHHQQRIQQQITKSHTATSNKQNESTKSTPKQNNKPTTHNVSFVSDTLHIDSDKLSIFTIISRLAQFGISISVMTAIYVAAMASLNNTTFQQTAMELLNNISKQITNEHGIIGQILN